LVSDYCSPPVPPKLAFNVGGTWKLNEHLNVLFSGGRDIVGDTHAMAYIGLQLLTKWPFVLVVHETAFLEPECLPY